MRGVARDPANGDAMVFPRDAEGGSGAPSSASLTPVLVLSAEF
jgi:hypothetical protein